MLKLTGEITYLNLDDTINCLKNQIDEQKIRITVNTLMFLEHVIKPRHAYTQGEYTVIDGSWKDLKIEHPIVKLKLITKPINELTSHEEQLYPVYQVQCKNAMSSEERELIIQYSEWGLKHGLFIEGQLTKDNFYIKNHTKIIKEFYKVIKKFK